MKLYEYKLVITKIKTRTFEVREGRTSYNAEDQQFGFSGSDRIDKKLIGKVLRKKKEWEKDNSLFLNGDVLYLYSEEDDVDAARKSFMKYIKNVLEAYDRSLLEAKKNKWLLSAVQKKLAENNVKIEEK